MNPWRLGTTSYILPEDILTNVRFLASRVQDVELVLFEVDDGVNNLPSTGDVGELARLGTAHGLSFTVHLPLDLCLAAAGARLHRSLEKAKAVIERMDGLDPAAYIVHIDGEGINQDGWADQAIASLKMVAEWAGDPNLLAVENLDGYPLDYLEPVVGPSEVGRCVDIGHLWLDGHDPVPYLKGTLSRTKVVHLHGIGSRDHQSLGHMALERIQAVIGCLRDGGYAGVLTLEVFSRGDFEESLVALAEAGFA